MADLDTELDDLVTSYGLPVRLAVGTGPERLIGWIDQDDRDDLSAALAALLRWTADVLDGDD